MAWLGRKPRRSVAGHENSLREAMRSRGGVAAKPAPAPTDIEDNEPDPERSTLEWLNLNAFAPKAIQGALDRMRATLGEEAQAKAEGLPASPRQKTVESLGSSLSSALRARGGITRSSLGPESRPQEPTEPCGQEDLRTPSPSPTPLKEQRPKEEEEDEEEDRILRSPREAGEDRILSRRKEEEDEEEDRILRSLREEGEDRILSRPKEEEEEGRILSRPKQEEQEEEEEGRILSRPKQEEEEEGQKDRILSRPKQEEDEEDNRVLSRPKEEEEEDNRVLSRPKEEEEEDNRVLSRPKEEEEEKDRILSRPKEEREDTAPRVPMPTPLMAATASAKRAEPPPMVQTHKPVQELPVPTKSLPAPDAYLSAQSKEVGKLKELREFWGSKNSKGFAGPGLAGSRLSKNEAQATLQRLLIAGGDFDEVRRLRKIISEQDC